MIDKGTILVRIFSVQHSIQYDGHFTPYHFLVFVLKEKYDSVLPKHKKCLSVVFVCSANKNKALFRIEVGHRFSLQETVPQLFAEVFFGFIYGKTLDFCQILHKFKSTKLFRRTALFKYFFRG